MNVTSNNTNIINALRLCLEIEAVLLDAAYSLVMLFHLLLLASTFVAILMLVHQYRRHSILLHGNLMLLFINVVLLDAVHTLSWLVCLIRYRVLLFVYKTPCDLMTPLWMVVAIYAPYYVYTIAYPALRFCIMIERVRATMLAEKYERENRRLGIAMVAGIWLLSTAYFVYVVVSAFSDPALRGEPSQPGQGVIYLTSKYNAQAIIDVNICILALMIGTAGCDWRILVVNRQKRDARLKNSADYSLSRNYQLKENALAMRLILPLDLSYALFYSLYIAVVLVIRANKQALPNISYTIYYNSADTLLFLHSAVTIVIYIHFIRFVSSRRARPNEEMVKLPYEQAKIHFKQLEIFWR